MKCNWYSAICLFICIEILKTEMKINWNFYRGIPEYIETVVFPSTGEDSQSQYVCVTLVVHLPIGYPDISPLVHLKNPRGLDENTVKLIQTETDEKCRDFLGQPVMFELIEVINVDNFLIQFSLLSQLFFFLIFNHK